jgi:SAM-dependent methyltransferase
MCPSCQARVAEPLFEKDGFRYVRCVECEGAWLDPMPAAPESQYGAEYFEVLGECASGCYLDYEGEEPIHRRNARRALANLATAPGRLLDVGCAVGFLLDEARQAGWTVTGVDASSWARQRARQRFGYEILPRVDAAPRVSFDAATVFQGLELLAEPAAELDAVRRALIPGGRLLIETWDRDALLPRLLGPAWHQVSPPTVLHLFGRRSLPALLKRCGFVDIRVRRAQKTLALGSLGALLANDHPRLLGWLGRLTRRPWLRNVPIPYTLRDLILVSARTPAVDANAAAPEIDQRNRAAG